MANLEINTPSIERVKVFFSYGGEEVKSYLIRGGDSLRITPDFILAISPEDISQHRKMRAFLATTMINLERFFIEVCLLEKPQGQTIQDDEKVRTYNEKLLVARNLPAIVLAMKDTGPSGLVVLKAVVGMSQWMALRACQSAALQSLANPELPWA